MSKYNFVKTDFCQQRSVPLTTPRITVYPRYQLTDTVYAITNYLRRVAPRSGDQLVAYHQHAVVIPGNVTLYYHFTADFRRYRVR